MIKMDLTNHNFSRLFIIGELGSNYDILINILYDQNFSYQDGLIFTGNLFNLESLRTLDCYSFLKTNSNCFSVLGKQEKDLVDKLEVNNEEYIRKVERVFFGEDYLELKKFIVNFPIFITYHNYMIVNAGVSPIKDIFNQPEDTYYSIGRFDEESRFYKPPYVGQVSWYDQIIRDQGKKMNICFSSIYLPEYKCPAGYNLGRSSDKLRCLIISSNYLDEPILVEGE